MSAKGEVLWEASFDPKVRTYWMINGVIVLCATVIGAPLIVVWLVVGHFFTARYLSHLSCTLTTRALHVSRGMFVRVEKTVPLDKITDVGLVHGPVMRLLGLRAISVETAGQSSAGALVRLVGVVDTERFRQAVLDQRDLVALRREGSGAEATSVSSQRGDGGASLDVLVDIRDTLRKIETTVTQLSERGHDERDHVT